MPMKRQQRSSITAALSLLSGLLLIAPAAFACGGGGSGGYRKPVRPDQFHHNGTQQSKATSSGPAPTSSGNTQTNGF
jgi:hypothetical protein